MPNNKPSAWFRRINQKLDTLDKNMDSLYQSTYSSRSDNQKDMENIVGTIDDTVDKIINGGPGLKLSDISNLYLRIQKKKGISNQSIVTGAMELFADNSIINSLSMNQDMMKYIYAEDYQYDMICKYMPSVENALNIKKDNVLSADNFTKDFLSVEFSSKNKNEFTIFNDRAKRVMNKYKFQDICEEMYHRASKYGECFLYIVPYNIAIQRLIKRKSRFGNGIVNTYAESAKYQGLNPSRVSILESSDFTKDDQLKKVAQQYKLSESDISGLNITLTFDDSNILAEAVEAKEKSIELARKSKSKSLNEAYNVMYEQALNEAGGDKEKVKFKSVYDKNNSNPIDSGVSDGLVINGGVTSKDDKVDEMNGCVVSFIDRGDILPIYIDELCVGYYHFSFSANDLNMCQHGFSYGNSGFGSTNQVNSDQQLMNNDMLINIIAQRISDNIDAHFVNSNKDLKEEIYSILKYNDKFSNFTSANNITVSFLPADDVFHFYLQQDRKTHRGISAIKKSIVPAMLYCLLYLTNTIGQVTRAQDKRIYYVKQNVETNVARTLMNVINQIKKGNMGMRQIESMNSILGIIGKYNDHVIPEGQNGESPIRFEVMEGQRLETPTELMERFNNDAVEGTDVPYEFTQSVNQVDYATRFTMSNSKFLRKVYKEQRISQEAFSIVFTKIYNYEYCENERTIKVLLPAPAYLSMVNTQELINNATNYAQSIVDSEIPNESEEIKSEAKRIITRNLLGTYVDYTKVDFAIEQAKLNVELDKSKNSES